MNSTSSTFYEERRELQEVLSTVFSRSSNLEKMLRYVCEKYFEGQEVEIKEYSIALDAFGRPPDFDPTKDSIVRVEAHRLRQKLARYYQTKGAHHTIRIVLPNGGYVPEFIRVPEGTVPVLADSEIPSSAEADVPLSIAPASSSIVAAECPPGEDKPSARWPWTRSRLALATLLSFVLLAVLMIEHLSRSDAKPSLEQRLNALVRRAPESPSLPLSSPATSSPIRIMAGTNAVTLTDEQGEIWLGDRYFQKGDAESVPPKTFSFTTTPSIYLHRRRENFSYAIPLPKGIYELRLHFADSFFGQDTPEGGGESSRLFDVKANGKTLLHDFDVIADAGGSNTADIKIFDKIEPAPDGFLHLDFISLRNVAFVNAIEIIPAPAGKMLALRVNTGTSSYTDSSGVVWDSDRYFRGGVRVHHDGDESAGGNSCNFRDERFGNFVYAIPVAQQGVYTARLWLCGSNDSNVQPTGKGENRFSVYLNGKTLLEDFSIPGGQSQPGNIVKQFTGIKPNAQGKLIFSFVPTRGYASLNGIEIDQE